MWIKSLRESQWRYKTGAGGSLNVDLLLASGGVIVVDPPSGPPRKFEYSGVGIGLSIPILKWLKL